MMRSVKVWVAWWLAADVAGGESAFLTKEAAWDFIWTSLAKAGGFDTTKPLPDDIIYWVGEKLDTVIYHDMAQVTLEIPEAQEESDE
jgi:hypothetical protein